MKSKQKTPFLHTKLDRQIRRLLSKRERVHAYAIYNIYILHIHIP